MLKNQTDFFTQVKEVLNEDKYTNLRKRLVTHRGWHRLTLEDDTRPLENTREAYKKSIDLKVGFAECDVFLTKDEKIILSHD